MRKIGIFGTCESVIFWNLWTEIKVRTASSTAEKRDVTSGLSMVKQFARKWVVVTKLNLLGTTDWRTCLPSWYGVKNPKCKKKKVATRDAVTMLDHPCRHGRFRSCTIFSWRCIMENKAKNANMSATSTTPGRFSTEQRKTVRQHIRWRIASRYWTHCMKSGGVAVPYATLSWQPFHFLLRLLPTSKSCSVLPWLSVFQLFSCSTSKLCFGEVLHEHSTVDSVLNYSPSRTQIAPCSSCTRGPRSSTGLPSFAKEKDEERLFQIRKPLDVRASAECAGDRTSYLARRTRKNYDL